MFSSSKFKTGHFLTVEDVATLLGYSDKTIRRWIKNGRLKAYRANRQLRISEADLQDFLNRSRA